MSTGGTARYGIVSIKIIMQGLFITAKSRFSRRFKNFDFY